MMNNITSLLKIDTAHIYIDIQKKILHLELYTNNFSKENSSMILEYVKNFWILANENNNKYYMIIDVKNVGIFPLSLLENIKECMLALEPIFNSNLHSVSLITDSDIIRALFKPLILLFPSGRPFTFVKDYTEALIYFKNPDNQNNTTY